MQCVASDTLPCASRRPKQTQPSVASSGAAIAVRTAFKKGNGRQKHGISSRDLDTFPTIIQRSVPHPRPLSLGMGAASTLNQPEASCRYEADENHRVQKYKIRFQLYFARIVERLPSPVVRVGRQCSQG